MNFFIILLTILILLTCTTNVCMYYLISKPQGVTGISGDKGKKGLPGQQGDMGPRGFKGETGDVGSKGPSQGLIGKKGPNFCDGFALSKRPFFSQKTAKIDGLWGPPHALRTILCDLFLAVFSGLYVISPILACFQ